MDGLTAWRAAWVVPVGAPPIPDAVVVAAAGRVVDIGPRPAIDPVLGGQSRAGVPVTREDLGNVALLPALVNAHTHLELTWMAGRLPASGPMPAWVQHLVRLRRTSRVDEVAASQAGIEMSLRCGTGVVGDVSNSLASCGPLARSPMRAVVFNELLGFNPADPAAIVGRAVDRARAAQAPHVDVTLGAHAPYSVAPALFREIACAAADLRPGVTAVHLAESPEELRFLRDGDGPWRTLLERVGTWTDAWRAPACGPVEYLARTGFLHRGLIVVHGVHLTRPELDRLAETGASVVTCPRSNLRLGVGRPPIEAFLASGVTIGLGTDSLASNDDLSVFAELAALRRLAPEVSPRRLIEIATIEGARALRVDDEYGSIAPGKRAAMIAVALPANGAGTDGDVEAMLLEGIDESRVRWVRA